MVCTCDPRYRSVDIWPAEDPCGHGDVCDGCPEHCPDEDEVGCTGPGRDDTHGIACEHPTCTDCGTVLRYRDDDCPECGRKEAG
jgi:hypothetical protein